MKTEFPKAFIFRSSHENRIPQGVPVFKFAIYAVFGLVALSALLGSTYVVDQGRFGLVQRFGKVVGVSAPGLHMKAPFLDGVVEIPSAVQTVKVAATAVSRDIQEVNTEVVIQYRIPEKLVSNIYANYRADIKLLEGAVIVPGAETVTKSVTAKYTAEDLISQRERVSSDLNDRLKSHIQNTSGLLVEKVEITNFGFSEAFTKAIEEKVTAQQAVLTERQNLEKKKVEAQRVVAEAEAEAKAMKMLADAEAYSLQKQRKNATELTVRIRKAAARVKMAENWKPTVIGGTPLIQVDGK